MRIKACWRLGFMGSKFRVLGLGASRRIETTDPQEGLLQVARS